MTKGQCIVVAVMILAFWEAVVVAQVDECSEGRPGRNALRLVSVMDHLGNPQGTGTSHTFISPLAESVGFDRFSFGASDDVMLESFEVTHTAPGPAPEIASLENHGNGLHWVQLTEPLTPGHWVEVQLNVMGSSSFRPARFDLWLARQPLDINQDGRTDIADATAFGEEFRGRKSIELIDLNGDGIVNVRDATAFGNIWDQWRNASLDTIRSSETIAAAIDSVVDIDTYTFAGQRGQRVTIQANRTSGGVDPQIHLFPPSGGDAEARMETDFGRTLLFAHRLAESGQYTILLRDWGGDETGEYLLSLLLLPGAITSPQDADGGVLAFDETRCGAIDPVVDMDVYTFTGQAGQRVNIQANRTSGGLDPQIHLFPPNGGDREARVETDFGRTLLFAHPLAESGQYTILLRDWGGDETGEYLLSLSALP